MMIQIDVASRQVYRELNNVFSLLGPYVDFLHLASQQRRRQQHRQQHGQRRRRRGGGQQVRPLAIIHHQPLHPFDVACTRTPPTTS